MKTVPCVSLQLLVMVLVFGNSVTFGQFVWTKDAQNPVLSGGGAGTWDADVATPWVIFNPDSGRYEMWYTGSLPASIGRAVSSDGIIWKRDSAPVLSQTAHGWDSLGVLAPCVSRDGGGYRMWYTGIHGPAPGGIGVGATGIGYATSADGKVWSKHQGNPVLTAGPKAWDAGSVGYCSTVETPGGFQMFYTGSSTAGLAVICRATSADGLTWAKDTINSPVLNAGAPGSWDRQLYLPVVMVDRGKYLMWYTAEATPGTGHSLIGAASSEDSGRTWTRDSANPVLTAGPSGSWDHDGVELGSVILKDSIHMWYDGWSASASYSARVGHATSPPPVAVQEHVRVMPATFSLGQNFPNPFNPTTVVSYQLPVVSQVKLAVYDILGREVTLLVNERKAPGAYTVEFDGSRLASGVYMYRLDAGEQVECRKMVLMK